MHVSQERLDAARKWLIGSDAVSSLLDYYPQLADRATAREITARLVVPDTGMYGRDYANVRDQIETICRAADA